MQHIADDYDTFGPLDNCSAFPFENHMKVLKKTVRKHHQPLQQAVNRYNEINNFKCIINESSQIINYPFMKCLKQHSNGPLIDDCLGPQFKKLVFSKITIDTTSSADCYVGTVDGCIIKVINICYDFKNKNKIVIIGAI